MNTTYTPDDEQKKLWNGVAGQAWVDAQAILDQMFKPLEDLLVNAVREKNASNVLDIGCGTGATTLAVARQSGSQVSCTGIDISAPMITAAIRRAKQENVAANFIVADAQNYPFAPASVDMIISRFGVMFFRDAVDAFANLKRAACDSAELRVIAWRAAAENPFMTTAERAAAPLLPNLPARKPAGPGQFAFADQQRVYQILNESGWCDIDLQPIDVACTFPADQLTQYLTRLGPLGLILQDADEQTRNRIVETVSIAFDTYVHGEDVRFDAACWVVSAR